MIVDSGLLLGPLCTLHGCAMCFRVNADQIFTQMTERIT